MNNKRVIVFLILWIVCIILVAIEIKTIIVPILFGSVLTLFLEEIISRIDRSEEE